MLILIVPINTVRSIKSTEEGILNKDNVCMHETFIFKKTVCNDTHYKLIIFPSAKQQIRGGQLVPKFIFHG